MWGSMDTKIENQHSNLLIAQICFGWISDTEALKWVEDIYSWTIRRVGSNAVNRPLNCDYFFISVIFRWAMRRPKATEPNHPTLIFTDVIASERYLINLKIFKKLPDGICKYLRLSLHSGHLLNWKVVNAIYWPKRKLKLPELDNCEKMVWV